MFIRSNIRVNSYRNFYRWSTDNVCNIFPGNILKLIKTFKLNYEVGNYPRKFLANDCRLIRTVQITIEVIYSISS